MTDAFADLVMPIFHNVINLQDRLAWGESPSLDDVKRQTRGWIDAAEQRAAVDAKLSDDFNLARFALVAWIDEVLTDSDWGRSVDWGSEAHVLEWDMYGSHIRANKFYQLSQTAESHGATDPLETFLLCVALGFRGVLGFNEEKLHEWVERVYSQVSAASPVTSRPFPEDPDDGSRTGLAPLGGPALLVKVSVLVSITALVTLLGYLYAVHRTYDLAS